MLKVLTGLVEGTGTPFNTTIAREIVSNFKAKLCNIPLDYELKSTAESTVKEMTLNLSVANIIIPGGVERFHCPEVFCQPCFIVLEVGTFNSCYPGIRNFVVAQGIRSAARHGTAPFRWVATQTNL